MFKLKTFLNFLFIAVLLLLSGYDAIAKEAPTGTVVAARGSVLAIDSSGAQRPLLIKSDLFLQDTVKTSGNGRVQLMFKDNTIISLGTNGELKIAEYNWDAGKQKGSMKTRLEEGTFRVLGGMITQKSPQAFSTETPAATIGIRGSMYAGKVENGNLLVVFLGGKGIYVTNAFGTVDINRTGFGTRVKQGQAPDEPEKFDEGVIIELLEGLQDELGTGDNLSSYDVSETTTDFTADNIAGMTNSTTEDGAVASGNVFINARRGNTVTAVDQGGNSITLGTAFVTRAGGLLTINADGSYDYTPPSIGRVPEAGLTETFSYTVTDHNGDPSSSTLAITVFSTPQDGKESNLRKLAEAAELVDQASTMANRDELLRNDPPMTGDDFVRTDEDTIVVINVASNDYDENSSIINWEVTQDPAHGTLVSNNAPAIASFNARSITSFALSSEPTPDSPVSSNEGSFTYQPDENYAGTDFFTYRATDVQGATSTGTVTINVTAVNDAPVAADAAATTPEDTQSLINVIPDASDVDGSIVDWTITADPAHGNVANNGDGTFTYDPSANYFGDDTFIYQVTDDLGATDTATVVIDISPVNDAPTAADTAATTPEDTQSLINVISDASDVDGTIVDWTLTTEPPHGNVANNGDGTFTYDPSANYFGDDNFTYQVTDDLGESGSATVTIDVTPVNDPPVAVDDASSTPENTVVDIDVSGNDFDVDGPIGGWTVITQPGHGTLVNNGDGTFSYLPDTNYEGSDSFTYQIFDDVGETSEAIVYITSTHVAVVVNMMGKAMRAFSPLNGDPSDQTTLDLNALSEDGFITSSVPGGHPIEPFTINVYAPNLSYSSVLSQVDVTLVTTASRGSFSTSRQIKSDNAGEFYVITNEDSSITLNDGDYSTVALSFAGVPTALAEIPSTGIDQYTGDFAHLYQETSGYAESKLAPFSLLVNWHNSKIIGKMQGSYFFGDLLGDGGLDNIQFVGSGPAINATPPYDVGTIWGTTSFGQLYGSDFQGIGLTATGENYSVHDQTQEGSWDLNAGAFRSPGSTQPSATTTETWNGWVIGRAEDMDGPANWPEKFSNYALEDFTMEVDQDLGTGASPLLSMERLSATRSLPSWRQQPLSHQMVKMYSM